MTHIIRKGAFTAPSSGYQIARSLRFNSADSAYLNFTPSAGTRTKFTLSFWTKRTSISAASNQYIVSVNAAGNDTGYFGVYFSTADKLVVTGWNTAFWTSTAVFRDPSAWMHIVLAVDTSASAGARIKVYVNGVDVTSQGTTVDPGSSANTGWNAASAHNIGRDVSGPSNYYNGYIAEFYSIENQQLTPSSFGQTDATTNCWVPKQYTGTYGTNGFKLNFSDNSNTTAATLGADSSGNGNNWTPNGLSIAAGTGNDSLTDTPTNYGTDTGAGGEVRGNYCTLNPVSKEANLTLSNGNLEASSSTTVWYDADGTIWSSTPFYFEATLKSAPGGTKAFSAGVANTAMAYGGSHVVGDSTGTYGVYWSTTTMYYLGNGGASTSITTPSSGDTYCFAVDPSTGKIWIGRITGGVRTWLSGNPATGTSPLYTGTAGVPYVPRAAEYDSGGNGVFAYNFGQRPFVVAAPSGFKALCTQNLSTPTIIKSSDYFDILTYTGNGGTTRSITGLGSAFDLFWEKTRSTADDHRLLDSVRAGGNDISSKILFPNLTATEDTTASGYVTRTSAGFDLATNASPFNVNARTYAWWCWKKGVTPGFDIVSFTGTGSAGLTVAHSLGVTPHFAIFKSRSVASKHWTVYHRSIGATGAVTLNTTNATDTNSAYWNNTAPTSSVFTFGTVSDINTNGSNNIGYIWTEVEGFSKFGSYTGNASSDGPFVYCGFRPRIVVFKQTTNAGNDWYVYDAVRNTVNVLTESLYWNAVGAANSISLSTENLIDIVSNGFKLRTGNASSNQSGSTFIFAAFAECPFKYARAR